MKRRALLGLGLGVAAAAGAGWPLVRPAQPGSLLKSEAPLPPRFRVPLPVPVRPAPVRTDGTTDYYDVTQRLATLRILPGLPTTAWTYGGTFPGPTIVSRAGRRTVVRHRNELPGATVVHLHGGHTPAESDGYPIDLVLPPSGQHDMTGMGSMMGATTVGERTYTYPMNQRAATLWYHDHAMGRTGPNVWRGMAGFHLVHDDAEMALPLPRGTRDVPLMITDRAFAADGSFRYSATLMNGVLGDVILVNGAPWPVLTVDRARYRLRLLNASNARRYRLTLDPGGPLVQIGADGGLLARPVTHEALEIAPGERLDVVVDFARFPAGTTIRLRNTLESGGTGDVMRFDIAGPAVRDDATVPDRLATDVPTVSAAGAVAVRTFRFHQSRGGEWTINGDAYRPGRALARPRLGTTEVWRFMTDFHHPVHVHLNHFQVLTRNGGAPGPYDGGWKDTVDVRPSEAVEVVTRFTDYAGAFMLHCHNLEHEDMAMMADFVTS